MATTVFETPSESVESKLEEGLAYRAVKSGNNWILPSGKNAANGDPVVLDGRFGYATAAIVGGTDAIIEDTNWKPYGDGGALGWMVENKNKYEFLAEHVGASGQVQCDLTKYTSLIFLLDYRDGSGNYAIYDVMEYPIDIIFGDIGRTGFLVQPTGQSSFYMTISKQTYGFSYTKSSSSYYPTIYGRCK